MPITLRPETPHDVADIAAVTVAAFQDAEHSSHTEQHIVAGLRQAGVLTISIVAEHESRIVGHVAVSPVSISDGATHWYGLGPISVLPEFQNRGIGSQLMEAALRRLWELSAQGCVVVGEPRYYQRFGFHASPQLTYPGLPPEYFMAVSLTGDLPRGVVSYHEAFTV